MICLFWSAWVCVWLLNRAGMKRKNCEHIPGTERINAQNRKTHFKQSEIQTVQTPRQLLTLWLWTPRSPKVTHHLWCGQVAVKVLHTTRHEWLSYTQPPHNQQGHGWIYHIYDNEVLGVCQLNCELCKSACAVKQNRKLWDNHNWVTISMRALEYWLA